MESVPEIGIAKDAIHCPNTVLPIDLLSLCIGAARVGDPHLEDPIARSRKFRRDFRFEAEAILLNINALNHFPLEALVARLHIRQIEISEHVRNEREEAISHTVPEIQHSMRTSGLKTGSIDDVGSIIEKRFEQNGILSWIIFEICVLNDDEIGASVCETCAKCSTFAVIPFVVNDSYTRVFDGSENRARSVSGAIVDYDDLLNHR